MIRKYSPFQIAVFVVLATTFLLLSLMVILFGVPFLRPSCDRCVWEPPEEVYATNTAVQEAINATMTANAATAQAKR